LSRDVRSRLDGTASRRRLPRCQSRIHRGPWTFGTHELGIVRVLSHRERLFDLSLCARRTSLQSTWSGFQCIGVAREGAANVHRVSRGRDSRINYGRA
jgi:hypothetical protein